SSLAKIEPVKIHMCSKSCIPYTGDYKDLQVCPYITKGQNTCKENQYIAGSKSKPKSQILCVSFIPIIQAMFSNKESSQMLRYRDK
ncbi:hypothetical protein SERLADRAFT_346673, partial [Serpula lacrymans var. lacrymans S7.9]